jgi:glutamine amidotransferase
LTDVAVLDYGAGNLMSISQGLIRAGLTPELVTEPPAHFEHGAAIIPGVGNYGQAMSRLREFRDWLVQLIQQGTPILGICLGMQVLFESSEESQGEGLSILSGRVVRLPSTIRVPHMGWNTIQADSESQLLRGLVSARAYFVHSYYVQPADEIVVKGLTEYGTLFPSVIESDSVYGTQFHPEKSGAVGRQILMNFASVVRSR